MSHTLNLIWYVNGSKQSISLTTTNFQLQGYTPSVPQPQARFTGPAADLGHVGGIGYQTVSEGIDLYCYASTKQDLSEVVTSIERFLAGAHRRSHYEKGELYYLEMTADGVSGTWRSEILYGSFQPRADALPGWANVGFYGTLFITRRFYWEEGSADPTDLTLTSATTGSTTSGVAITNNDADNWAQCSVTSDQDTGNIDTPAIMEIEWDEAPVNEGFQRIYVTSASHASVGSVDYYLAGGDSVGGATLGPTSNPSEVVEIVWDLGQTDQLIYAGGYARAIMCCSSLDLGGHAQLRVSQKIGAQYMPIEKGPRVLVNSEVVDLGVFAWPPGGNSSAYINVAVEVAFWYTGTFDGVVDFIQITPALSDRRIINAYPDLILPDTNDIVVDDGAEGYTYVLSGTDKLGYLTTTGRPVIITPTAAYQRWFFLCDSWQSVSLTTYESSLDMTICMKWRPRRLSI